jgi:uncharacterized membrane protein
MDEEHALPKGGGVTTLLFTVLLVSPCFFAWASSYVISQGGINSHSGMWFLYQVSQYLAYLGLLLWFLQSFTARNEGCLEYLFF